jgi:hypothetical protein
VPKQVHSQASLREGKAWGIKAVLIWQTKTQVLIKWAIWATFKTLLRNLN